MNDLSPRAQRLIELTRQVDGPGASRRTKVRAGLGAALVAGTVSSAARAGLLGTVGSAKLATSSATVVGGLKAWGLFGSALGWLAAGATLGVVVAVTGHYALSPPAASREPAASKAPPPRAGARASNVPPERPSSTVVSIPSAPPAQTGASARTTSPSPPVIEPLTLAEETRLLEETQVALRSGNSDRALALLSQYEHRFGTGALREEAQAARVLALCKAGQIEAGRSAAAQFSRAFPGSPLLPRVLRSCDPARGAPAP